MKYTSRYPGSFGEIIQCRYKGFDVLVSCPINLYSTVTISESKESIDNTKTMYNKSKAYSFTRNILNSWGYEKLYNEIHIEIDSKISIGKGLSSSTADLCACYQSLIKMFNKNFNRQELINNCIKIEPTDSIIFNEFTIFDYKNGTYKETIGDYIGFHILCFEGLKCVNTIEFNSKDNPPLYNGDKSIIYLKKYILEKNIKGIGEIASESIINNQKRIRYDYIDKVIELNKRFNGLGIIGAHSGNALGIIFDDEESLKHAKKRIDLLETELSKKLKIYSIYTLKTIDMENQNFTN